MRIAVLSTPHIAAPPRGYGASELIAGLVAEDLTRRGHDVTLFATADSPARVTALRHCPAAVGVEPFEQRELLHVAAALAAADDVDIIHNHCLMAGPPVLAAARRPAVTTLHYTPTSVRAFPQLRYVAVSHRQRALVPNVSVAGVIHHGIDLEAHPFCATKDDYLLFLGRFHANKGPHLAIKVAQRLNARLIIAAPPPPADQVEFFQTEIRPHLSGKIEWIGSVESEEKARLLGQARCLLGPICWEEPFGLVYVEALACGTPVVTFRRGATPEIVRDGETGFLVDDLVGMRDAVERVEMLQPSRCRRDAEARFDRRRMADDYLRIYQSILNGSRSAPPHSAAL